MEADEEKLREREEETARAKDVEFFAAGVNAWYNTALEHDKSIFALAAGSIGLLVSTQSTSNASTTPTSAGQATPTGASANGTKQNG
jgi:hypothetical protein